MLVATATDATGNTPELRPPVTVPDSLARLSLGYETGSHRSTLDERIAMVAERSPAHRTAKNGEGMMIVSELSCSGCHQR